MSFCYTVYTYNDSSDEESDATGRPTKPRRMEGNEDFSSKDEEVPSNPPRPMKARQLRGKYHDFCSYRFQEKIQFKHVILAVVVIPVLTFFLGFLTGGIVWSNRNNGDAPGVTTDDPNSPSNDITVGVYYYPWYKDDFHRGGGYVRKQLSPPQQPWLGEYDDSDPSTVSKHLQWSRQANIHLWVSSWWGEGRREDETLKNTILKHPEIGSHQIAIFYETTGRIKESEGFSTQRVAPDIEYLCREYFGHPNYFHVEEKPVLFVYLTRKLESAGKLSQVLDLMRSSARDAGCGELYIVGDHVFQGPPDVEEVYPPFTILDAVTNYDVYGSMGGKGGYMGRDGVINYYQNQQRQWQAIANDHNCAFIPAASPGYNDLGVRPAKGHVPLSRRLSPTDHPGSLFQAALQQARTLVDANARNLLMVNSFNEFHEDTQIEPCIGSPSNLPETLTHGLEYEGYGELYLQILRKETTTLL
mmetsp:Transcript_3442/g.6280  ORF Transcript_3442/g.6280 Transcript_3442/m.6280 type:complete len:471 (+) Transcript_3442:121-1533(+)